MGLLDRITDRAVALGQAVASRVMAPERAARAAELDALEKLYRGTQYEGRGLHPSWDKVPPGQRQAPLRMQKPSVQYELPRLIVNRVAALLFGAGHFPELAFEPDAEGDAEAATAVTKWLTSMADDAALSLRCLAWARGACAAGSGALVWSTCEGRFEFRALRSSRCTPTFDPKRPDRLIGLELRYRFHRNESVLVAGVASSKRVECWHRETWDAIEHVVYDDVPVGDGKEPTWSVSEGGRVEHKLGFVPAVWVKSLADDEEGCADGESVLGGIGALVEDMDRTMSQKSRALRYNLDPERIYYGWTVEQINALRVGGDASTKLPAKDKGTAVELLEMSDAPHATAEAHVAGQRARALEVSRVVSPDADKVLAAAHSGAAIRLLYAPTLELLGELQQTFGRALRSILEQILLAIRDGLLVGAVIPAPPALPAGRVTLLWGDTFEPTPEDLTAIGTFVAGLYEKGLLARETAVRYLAPYVGVRDVAAELERLDEEAETDGAVRREALAALSGKPAEKPGDAKDPEQGESDDDGELSKDVPKPPGAPAAPAPTE